MYEVKDAASEHESEREKLLKDTIETVCKDHADAYGNLEENFWTIARLWSIYLVEVTGKEFFIDSRDVANMMVLLNVARNVTSGHRDNWVDIAGYAACGSEVDNPHLEPIK